MLMLKRVHPKLKWRYPQRNLEEEEDNTEQRASSKFSKKKNSTNN